MLILSPALRRWKPPRRHGSCSQSAHLWATANFVSRSEELGTPDSTGYVANVRTCRLLLILSPALKPWGPDGRSYVAIPPSFGPLLIWSPAMKCWEPPQTVQVM